MQKKLNQNQNPQKVQYQNQKTQQVSKANPKAKAKKEKKKKDLKTGLKIGVVSSRFNEEITEKLESGAIEHLMEIHQSGELSISIASVKVPGAVEIPLACKILLDHGCDGVVAVGAVIRGETSHYDVVCNSVERGVTQLMLEYGKPIGFGVITTENEEQALDRAGGRHGNKGKEAAQVTLEMIGLVKNLAAL